MAEIQAAKGKKLFAPVDMTQGTPWKQIATFAVPLLIGNVVQQLYNTVDSIVVGKYVGDNALAAVGSAMPVMMIMIVLFVGIGTGVSVMVSQYLGARKREELSITIANSMTLTGIVVIFIMVVASLLARPMLVALKTPASYIDWCQEYLLYMFIGSAGHAFYNLLNGILRGLGDSVSAMVFLIISCVLNIFGDLFCVAVLGMGVGGVALATVVAQFISAILCFMKMRKMTDMFDIKKENFRLQSSYVKDIIRLGLPTGLMQAVMSISMLITQPIVNLFGESFVAANVMVQRVDGFATLPSFTFGIAMTTYAGQNFGAGRMDRVEKGTRQGLALSLLVSGVLTVLILAFGRSLMGLFTNTQSQITLAMGFMYILAIGYLALAITQTLSGVMRGCGDAATPMWISIAMNVIVRVPLVYIMKALTISAEHPQGKPQIVFQSLLITWVLGALVTVIFYRMGRWKTRRQLGAATGRASAGKIEDI